MNSRKVAYLLFLPLSLALGCNVDSSGTEFKSFQKYYDGYNINGSFVLYEKKRQLHYIQ